MGATKKGGKVELSRLAAGGILTAWGGLMTIAFRRERQRQKLEALRSGAGADKTM